MRGKAVPRKVSVIGLIIHLDGQIATRQEQISDVEITDESGRGVWIVPVTKLPVDEQTIVQQSSTEQSFILGVIESFSTRGDVGSKIPVGVVDDGIQHVVDLLT